MTERGARTEEDSSSEIIKCEAEKQSEEAEMKTQSIRKHLMILLWKSVMPRGHALGSLGSEVRSSARCGSDATDTEVVRLNCSYTFSKTGSKNTKMFIDYYCFVMYLQNLKKPAD